VHSFPRLKSSYDEANAVISEARFSDSYLPHLLGAMYAGQMVETAYALLTLGESKSSASHLLLIRSIFETGVRLCYLAASPAVHGMNLDLEDCISRKRAMTQMQEIEHDPLVQQKLEAVQNRITSLVNDDGAKVEKLEGMLKVLNSQALYLSFRRLSSSAHSQILGLSHQFLTKHGDSFTVHLFKPCTQLQSDLANELAADFLGTIATSFASLKMQKKSASSP
jgi:hypothetical protein